MARAKSDGKQGNGSGRPKGRDGLLKLVRVEPLRRNAISLVFESDGVERSWKLENTSTMEFLALLLRGRMLDGRRVVLPEAELTLEPPEEQGDPPTLCMAAGPLELCATVDRAGARALKADIERALRRPG